MAEFINTIDVLGDDAVIDSIIDRSITEFKDDVVTKIPMNAFRGCASLVNVALPRVNTVEYQSFAGLKALESVDLPELTTGVDELFYGCDQMKSVNMPKLQWLKMYMFRECKALTSIFLPEADALGYQGGVVKERGVFRDCISLITANLPKVSNISDECFYGCSSLKVVDFSSLKTVHGDNFFAYCRNLIAFIIRNTENVVVASTKFANSSIASGTCYIYVPRALVDSYKAATNWATYGDQIRALEDYTVDGTITGELDEIKI